MTNYWCESAWLEEGPVRNVRLSLSNGRFAKIDAGVKPADSDEILRGMVLPGAANVHSHTFHRALRGAGVPGGSFWSWRETMYRVAQALTPQSYYELARAAYTEMLLSGYTAVGEFHYVHHQPDGTPYPVAGAMEDALISAAADSGIRLTLLDTLYLSSGFGEPLTPEQIRFSDGDADSWTSRMEAQSVGSRAKLGAAIHSVRAVPARAMSIVAEWARAKEAPLHVHVSEQEKENSACIERTGKSPVALLRDVGIWQTHATAVHATFLADSDIATLGSAEAFVCFCPSTEADLADGIGPALRLHEAGARLTIGSDQNVVTDPFAEMNAIEMNQRLLSGTRENFTPRELVRFMSCNGYDSLGWQGGGTLSQGGLADFVLIDTSHMHFAGVKESRVPLHATASDIVGTFVAGDLVADHRISSVPMAQELGTVIGDLRTIK